MLEQALNTCSFNRLLWRIFPDPVAKILVIELRDGTESSTTFSSINLFDCKLLLDNYELKNQWWVGIEEVYDGKIFIHEYNTALFSSHLGIYCLDAFSGAEIWKHTDLVYYKGGKNFVFGYYENAPEKLVAIDRHTGIITENFTNVDLNSEIAAKTFNNNNLIYPQTFYNKDPSYSVIAGILKTKYGRLAVENIEYLDHRDKIIISFYELKEGLLINYLFILNSNGNILLDITLDNELKGIGSEAFFIFDNKLIFVKFKKELCIYDL